jgi:hypothetical protein
MIRRFKEIHEFEKRISQEPDFQKKIKPYDEMYLCRKKLIAEKELR